MIGHFTQADTIIPEPGKASSWDRYSYVQNNPVKYNDPSGHKPCDDVDKNGKCITKTKDWRKPLEPSTQPKEDPLNIWDNQNTKTSEAGRIFIKSWETLRNTPYSDDPENPDRGNCTVGWGHKLHPGPCNRNVLDDTREYALDEIDSFFEFDLHHKEVAIRDAFQKLDNLYRPNPPYSEGNPVPINQYQFDALVSFGYNAGEGSVQELIWKSVEIVPGTENGFFIIAALESNMSVFTDPNQPGLALRREQELLIFNQGKYTYFH